MTRIIDSINDPYYTDTKEDSMKQLALSQKYITKKSYYAVRSSATFCAGVMAHVLLMRIPIYSAITNIGGNTNLNMIVFVFDLTIFLVLLYVAFGLKYTELDKRQWYE